MVTTRPEHTSQATLETAEQAATSQTATVEGSAPSQGAATASGENASDEKVGQLPGQLIVLSGPSGVGKGTLLRQMLAKHPDIKLSVSATTRQPREGEVDGQHYYFVSQEKFEDMVNKGELLEWAQFAGNSYGTPRAPIEAAIAEGEPVILEIELLGARQVRKSLPTAKQIFISPPSAQTLEVRIRERGQDSESAIAKRLAQAKIELASAKEFDVIIVNDDLSTAVSELEHAIFG